MNSEKIILAFAKVKEDMTFLKKEIGTVSKKSEKQQKLVEVDPNNTIKKLEKSVIKLENDYKEDLDKTYKIIAKIREEFEEKINIEISALKSEFEEKLTDIEQSNSFEGEDLY
jgi:biopolymer transport protein ExbB/TolQ